MHVHKRYELPILLLHFMEVFTVGKTDRIFAIAVAR